MVNDKKRLIGKIAAKVPEGYKEAAFMVSPPSHFTFLASSD